MFLWRGGGGKMLAVDISDIFVPMYQTSRRYKQNDPTLNLHHCETWITYVEKQADKVTK